MLIVDDDKEVTKALRMGLESAGFDVDAYNDPAELLSDYKPGGYMLVIMDIRMPQMDGFELFRELKKRDSKVKVCFLTGFEIYAREFEKLFPDTKVEGFLKKPISVSTLASEIKKITAKGGSQHRVGP